MTQVGRRQPLRFLYMNYSVNVTFKKSQTTQYAWAESQLSASPDTKV